MNLGRAELGDLMDVVVGPSGVAYEVGQYIAENLQADCLTRKSTEFRLADQEVRLGDPEVIAPGVEPALKCSIDVLTDLVPTLDPSLT